MRINQNYTTSFAVDQSPRKVFAAINNVRGWWSEEIEGRTDRAGAEWTYRYKDIHRCKMKIAEFIPGQKVVWLVVDNHFNFTKDETEWKGTRVIFEISKKDNKTEVRFTHQGLVPQYECFDVCSDAWGSYIKGSLRNLIAKGKGQPSPLEKAVAKARKMSRQDYTTSFTVGQTPKGVFDAINNVRGWWSGEVEGNTDKLGAEFTYCVPGAHRSKQKVTDFVPGKKVVWHVSDAQLGFVKDKSEWKGTDIVFDIAKHGDKTEVRFTHKGLVPAYECYSACSNAWGMLINGNLRKLITTGKPQPSPW
jgi:Activator of Hsp90 ATPase homolog 1-like protein